MNSKAGDSSVDIPTTAAIAVVVGFLELVVHEAAGHGGAALLLGAHVSHVSSVDLVYDGHGVSRTAA